ncbi:MAG: TonB family protein [Desulfovibrio sp.]|jgi:protein TonB|nr:TonB family protein [Desulfovibrio sp.]
MTLRRCFPFVFSLFLHGGVMAGLVLLPDIASTEEERIYHVSLEEFSLAGASASPGRTAGDAAGERPAQREPESASGAARDIFSAPEPEAASSEDAPEKPAVGPQNGSRSETAPSPRRKRRRPAAPDVASASRRESSGLPSRSGQGGVERPFAVAPDKGGGEEGGTSSSASGFSGLDAKDGVHDASLVDQKPSILRRVKPEYPAKARNSGIDGTVVVRIVIDVAGLPSECAVHSASPPEYFEEAALEAARRTRFLPGRIRGRPVRTLVLLPFAFRLK